MRIKNLLILSKFKQSISIITLCMFAACSAAPAKALTAEDVMKKMTKEQRSNFLLGVIEGLAFSRYIKDKPSTKGMKCIHDWQYGPNSRKNTLRMYDAFDKLPSKPAVPLMYLLIKKECGA